MIEDLYVKPGEGGGSASKTRRQLSRGDNNSTSRRSLGTPNGATQHPVFHRLYQEGLELQRKKFDMQEEEWRSQQNTLFSPKITQKAKEVKRKEMFVFSAGYGINEETQQFETPINVFDYLSEDAIRRRRDQELIELAASQNRTFNLISENSTKILLKKVLADFSSAIH
jgi:hypothetical protein